MGSDKDNPFADPGDGDRTVMRPSPGRRAAAPNTTATTRPASTAPPRTVPPRPRDPGVALPAEGLNPIVAAASVLLTLVAGLQRGRPPADVAALRERVIDELRLFERKIRALSLPTAPLKGAHYAICATIDDVVLNTPWGSRSLWTSQSLVSSFHNDVTGGERFFDILQSLERDPAGNIDALELMYACLALGFEGKYRVDPRGSAALSGIRDDLYRLIRQERGAFECELSPRWRGVPAPHRSFAARLPIWVVAAVAGAMLLGGYMGLSFALSNISDPVFAALARLPPRGPVSVANAATATPGHDVARPSTFLAREVAAQLAAVTETDRNITVTLRTTNMFPSGSATIEPRYVGLLQRIADEIQAKEPGRVLVLGHTDNVPIRTIRFPSNYALSLARARAAAAIIAARLSQPDRVSAEGRADTEPVQPNTTPAGRDANRRIEIVILKSPPGSNG